MASGRKKMETWQFPNFGLSFKVSCRNFAIFVTYPSLTAFFGRNKALIGKINRFLRMCRRSLSFWSKKPHYRSYLHCWEIGVWVVVSTSIISIYLQGFPTNIYIYICQQGTSRYCTFHDIWGVHDRFNILDDFRKEKNGNVTIAPFWTLFQS